MRHCTVYPRTTSAQYPVMHLSARSSCADVRRFGHVINKDGTNAQAIDPHGGVISGLYACGDLAGGFGQHGICRAATFGRFAGSHAANQQS
jgi:succinate dehydrogenase/fumarate reductase flavoprotein subunit